MYYLQPGQACAVSMIVQPKSNQSRLAKAVEGNWLSIMIPFLMEMDDATPQLVWYDIHLSHPIGRVLSGRQHCI
jgi:hypothetical protein